MRKDNSQKVIKPTLGEFNFRDEKQKFARLYFWSVVKKVNPLVLKELRLEPLKLFQSDFRFCLYSDVCTKANWGKEPLHDEAKALMDSLKTWQEHWHFGITKNTESEWIIETAFDFVKHWHSYEKDREEMFLALSWTSSSIDICPKSEGLENWHYVDEKQESYTERQKQHAKQLLNENPLLATASPYTKNFYADNIKMKAETYCREVNQEIQKFSPNTKRTDSHPNFERDMLLVVRILCERPTPSWRELAEESLKNKGYSYTKNTTTLNKKIRTLKQSVKVMLELLGLQKESIFKTQGRPKKD